MKTLEQCIKTFLIISVSLIIPGCQNEVSEIDENAVEFEMSFLQEESGSLLKSTHAAEIEKAAAIIITIKTSAGSPTDYTSSKLKIQQLNGTFISEKILLKTGCYNLTEFMLADSSGNITYAAPTSGTTLGDLVDNPLPIGFCVEKNKSKKIQVGVVNTNDKTPEDFGIASFYMISPTVMKFPVAIVDYESGKFLAATIEVTNFDWDSDVSSYQEPIENGKDVYRRLINTKAIANNLIVLDDTYPTYTIKVMKDGYTGFSCTYCKDSLLHYALPGGEGPLKIEIATTVIGSVTDIDGNKYNTVKIGSQVWMQENLLVTRYNDGPAIDISDVTFEYEPYQPGNIVAFYSYNIIMNSEKLCPKGWHVPTIDDWNILFEFLGGPEVAGGKLKGGPFWECDDDIFWMSNYFSELYKMDNLSNFTANPLSIHTGILGGGYDISFWALKTNKTGVANIFLSADSYAAVIRAGNGQCLRCIRD